MPWVPKDGFFDQAIDPGCELDRLRAENTKLKAALVATEAEREAVLDSLNALAYLVHGAAECLMTGAQSLAPGAPTPSGPTRLAVDLTGLREEPGQVIPLHMKTAAPRTGTADQTTEA